MRARKTKDLKKVLKQKGFELKPEKKHHQYYYLIVDNKKTAIKTYFSHSKNEYDSFLMSPIKKQLKFKSTEKAEDFFDCTMSKKDYVDMLREDNEIE